MQRASFGTQIYSKRLSVENTALLFLPFILQLNSLHRALGTTVVATLFRMLGKRQQAGTENISKFYSRT